MDLNKLELNVKKNGYLFDQESYDNIIGIFEKKTYLNLSLISYSIKYAMRTLNTLLKFKESEKEEMFSFFMEDLKSGSWTIDFIETNKVREYWDKNDLEEIQASLIGHCFSWAENEIES